MSSFEDQLDNISYNEKNEKENQYDININQTKDENIVRDGNNGFFLDKLVFKNCQNNNDNNCNHDNNALSLAPSQFPMIDMSIIIYHNS